MGHARLGPSAAGRWVHCPGSIPMEERYPDLNEEDSEEGTASHWVAGEILQGHPAPLVNTTAPNGVILTAEAIESAHVYADAVLAAVHGTGAGLVVEKPIAIPSVNPECWGTPDTWYFLPAMQARELHIWDYKYGYGIVEAVENWQGICYASGILDHLASRYGQAPGVFDQTVSIIIHVVQPRPFHVLGPVREWRLTGGTLRGYVNRLVHAASNALSESPTVNSGPQCRYCHARHACPAAQKAAMFSIEYSGQGVPEELSPQALAIELRTLQRAAKAIEYRLTGIEAQVAAVIDAGGHVPGWSIQRGNGRPMWAKPAEEVFALGDLLGIKLRKAPEPITPAQAKAAGIPDDLITAYTVRSPSGAKLVPWSQTLTARVFGGGR